MNMNSRSTLHLLLLATVAGCSPQAEIQPSALFTDGVVLQRGVEIHVWGTARPGAGVEVTLGDLEVVSIWTAFGPRASLPWRREARMRW